MTNLHLICLGVLSCTLIKDFTRGSVLFILKSGDGPDGVL